MAAVSVRDFLACPAKTFDVRSPGEFSQGHIPGAVNLPLFTDEERAQVGTIFKKSGQEEAFQIGLGLILDKIPHFIEEIARTGCGDAAKIYCARGGLRSRSFGSLFEMIGLNPCTLQGGYKSFRRLCHEMFAKKFDFRIIGGMTGSGKTNVLHALNDLKAQTIDLEALSNHRGGAFGEIIENSQPTTEHFQNLIGSELFKFDPAKPVWLEDESRLIGKCHLPESLFEAMQKSPLYLIEPPLEMRLERLNRDYGKNGSDYFISSVKKLKRKLGGEKTETVIAQIEAGKLKEAAILVLTYYDKAYRFALSKRAGQTVALPSEFSTSHEIANWLIKI